MSPKNLRALITDFIEFCELEKGLFPSTSRKYHYRLNRFREWARRETNINELYSLDLTEELIKKFRLYLNRYINPVTKRGLMASTQNHYVVALRSFLKYLARERIECVAPERIELRKSDSRLLKFLQVEQLDELLSQTETTKVHGLRDRAIMELLFSTGLRVSELVGLDREDINLKTQEFSIIGKGGRVRIVFISDRAKNWLQKYLDRRDDEWEPLFISHSHPPTRRSEAGLSKGSKNADKLKSSIRDHLDDPSGNKFRLSVRSVQRMIKRYSHKAGLPVEVTPHVLRHTFATDLLYSGADLRSVQELLGHKNVSTTQIYTHVTNPRLREVYRKFHGKSGNSSG
ncbi:tyrosine-type recombinase/integrase [Patescibacteria group bacterium]|nr:tyrosine-type recombinase/integrase [Patescibacteria group bacterium]MBU1868534.1 tyrosine-type recombinase/integrase [Patescibacteria group bacterium]